MAKQCPINNARDQGVSLVAGRTQMMLGVNQITTWNQTTKRFEPMARFALTSGTNGGKIFRFGPSKLI
jgi:hypothetical protein